ncbi:hypothetical protein BD626DRAFT_567790 [Schizophyllum amplum]|uniref:Uncharacterized protein n=1 Tax=Schizophyllum amplum TaxID=97359 RepID=A0A550CJI4_9AGAR|nr:hypothetical protein BD626DRAFT_567790 [Auriculariopsis ampla]
MSPPPANTRRQASRARRQRLTRRTPHAYAFRGRRRKWRPRCPPLAFAIPRTNSAPFPQREHLGYGAYARLSLGVPPLPSSIIQSPVCPARVPLPSGVLADSRAPSRRAPPANPCRQASHARTSTYCVGRLTGAHPMRLPRARARVNVGAFDIPHLSDVLSHSSAPRRPFSGSRCLVPTLLLCEVMTTRSPARVRRPRREPSAFTGMSSAPRGLRAEAHERATGRDGLPALSRLAGFAVRAFKDGARNPASRPAHASSVAPGGPVRVPAVYAYKRVSRASTATASLRRPPPAFGSFRANDTPLPQHDHLGHSAYARLSIREALIRM